MSERINQPIVQWAILFASAAAGTMGFVFMFSDSPSPMVSAILSTVLAVSASCLIGSMSPKRWILIALLCSWGVITWGILGVLMQQQMLQYMVAVLPVALAAGYIGSRIGLARRSMLANKSSQAVGAARPN